MYIYIYVQIYMYTWLYIYIHTYVCMHIWVHIIDHDKGDVGRPNRLQDKAKPMTVGLLSVHETHVT